MPAQHTIALPPYRAMLVVDLKDFSGNAAADQGRIGADIPVLLRDTFQRMGHGYLHAEAKFLDHTGDGYAMGFRPRALPALLDLFPATLQAELADRAKRAGTRPQRMRVSITVGPLTDKAGTSIRDGQGAARIEVHRLLDAKPVRDLLTRSNPEVTLVATIISARVYEDVVMGGYCQLSAESFVPAPVEVKSYQGKAYLHVPVPSGDLLVNGFAPQQPVMEPAAEPESAASVRIGDVDRNSGVVIGTNTGGFTFGGQR
ncbi:hypothetical protein [Kutzneria sp. CA-103260]|uniref:hypothetical protein n=1 Tax=Kutzneria sp. CA-103260 TaxID=2802641 RepID=UPI001BA96609|nr:hypothetical protein [Kutzneria sp. CA-103260]QUQ71491.1 hypothetical protein JJ691_92780 [Kutzneria sp. CA-103260]